MSDRTAVVWTRATGLPRRLGLIVKTGDRVRFTYGTDVAGLPGISVVHDTRRTEGRTFEYASTERNPLPPMFQSLVPPRHESNLQRRILVHLLERDGRRVPQGADLDWAMLVVAGRNGIGHLDVFASDEAASAYYAEPVPAFTLEEIVDRPLWRLVSDATSPTAEASTIEEIADQVKSHPSVGGMMPKLLARIRRTDGSEIDALVKIGGSDHPHVLALENLAYEIHDRIGTGRPRRRFHVSADGLEIMATERFDRADGVPVPLESAFTSLYAASAGAIQSRWSDEGRSPTLEAVADLIRESRAGVSTSPRRDVKELFVRTVVALLTGNGDNHLENHSFLGARDQARLSPLYDPAPMRGYHRHQMVSSVSFGGLAFVQGGVPSELGDAVVRFGTSCGLQKRVVLRQLERCLAATEDFRRRVLDVAPGPVGAALSARIEGVRYRIERSFLEAKGAMTPSVRKPEEDDARSDDVVETGPSWT